MQFSVESCLVGLLGAAVVAAIVVVAVSIIRLVAAFVVWLF